MNKRILIIVNHDIVIYNFRKELVENLLSNDFEVFISSPDGPNINKLIDMGAKHTNVKLDRHGINPYFDLKLILHYIKLIKRIDPFVILTYTIKPNIYGGIAAIFTKKPYLANITGVGSALLRKGLLGFITSKMYKIALKSANVIFFQNKENMVFMKNKKISGKSSILIPGSGVNTDYFHYLDYPSANTLNFLFVGRIMKAKGIDHYLSAAKHIKNKYPNTMFHVIGPYEENYSNKIKHYEFNRYIKYHGRVNDIRLFYQIAHAIIHPSYYEGMSNVLLEAAACGRPIIASNISGCIETFDEGLTGLSFQNKSTLDLIDKIENFINFTHENKMKMGLRGREKVEKEFNRKTIVNVYLKEIRKIMTEVDNLPDKKSN